MLIELSYPKRTNKHIKDSTVVYAESWASRPVSKDAGDADERTALTTTRAIGLTESMRKPPIDEE